MCVGPKVSDEKIKKTRQNKNATGKQKKVRQNKKVNAK